MKQHNRSIWKFLWDYGVITLGCALYALSFNWCFQPNNLAFGGFTGAGQIINRLIPALPVGVLVFVMNVPLFLIGVRKIGWSLLVSSLYAMTVGSAMIDVMAAFHTFQPMEPMLACIYGGVLIGLSMGLMLQVGATTGGTELGARLLKYCIPHLSIGRLCLAIDLVIISAYALVFHNLHNALYGVVAMYISSLVMDTVIYGSLSAKMAYIITGNNEEMAQKLLDMDLGVTILPARGAYTGKEKNVLLCAFKRSQIAAVKRAVHEADPEAFLIVCEAHEVMGERFGSYDPDSL